MIRTARLTLSPVESSDLDGLIALKADPLVYGQMLGGARSPWQVVDELAEDRAFWAAHRIGMFSVREAGVFQGTTGIHQRPDGRGLALRFAVWPEARGRGRGRWGPPRRQGVARGQSPLRVQGGVGPRFQ